MLKTLGISKFNLHHFWCELIHIDPYTFEFCSGIFAQNVLKIIFRTKFDLENEYHTGKLRDSWTDLFGNGLYLELLIPDVLILVFQTKAIVFPLNNPFL